MKPLAIVGNGMTRDTAPKDTNTFDIWAMNNHPYLWEGRQPITALFEMHPDVLEADRYDEGYKDWLKNITIPVYMHRAHPGIPNSVTFPREEIAQKFTGAIYKGDELIENFYAESSTYMLALALHMGYQHVQLHGIDLNKIKDHTRRDAVFFWLGILITKGVIFKLPEATPLMKDTLYPFY